MEDMTLEVRDGLIVKSVGGLYSVRTADGSITECRAKGSFRKSGMNPLAGDRVCFEVQKDGSGFITRIYDRKNSLIRPAAANIDMLVIVAASADPNPDLFVLDKLTAVAAVNNIEVLLAVNKDDIKSADELCAVYSAAGFQAEAVCTKKKELYAPAFERIRNKLCGKITFFTGASGVGKSSLINVLFPSLELSTGSLSRKIQRGKHTTRTTELFCVGENTFIGDTPGFSMLDVAGFGMINSESLLAAFPDIEKYAFDCKYTKCTHVCEDGCGVMKALNDGKIQPSRHESYKRLYDELKKIKPWDNKE